MPLGYKSASTAIPIPLVVEGDPERELMRFDFHSSLYWKDKQIQQVEKGDKFEWKKIELLTTRKDFGKPL